MLSEVIDHFDLSYVINLRTRADKKREAVRQFNRFGIDPASSKLEFYTTESPEEKGLFASKGQRGCYTSHLNLLKMALEQNARNLLVFEDDVCFQRTAMEYAGNITNELRDRDWDIIYFGFKTPKIRSWKTGFVEWQDQTEGAQFYGINRPLMEKMVTYMTECANRPNGHPDGGASFRDVTYNRYRMNNPQVKTFIHSPSLAAQSGYHSDLHDQRSLYNYEPVTSIVKACRHVRSRWRGR